MYIVAVTLIYFCFNFIVTAPRFGYRVSFLSAPFSSELSAHHPAFPQDKSHFLFTGFQQFCPLMELVCDINKYILQQFSKLKVKRYNYGVQINKRLSRNFFSKVFMKLNINWCSFFRHIFLRIASLLFLSQL